MLKFGKYKGRDIKKMTSVEETKYLHWLLQSDVKVDGETKKEIKKQLNIKQ